MGSSFDSELGSHLILVAALRYFSIFLPYFHDVRKGRRFYLHVLCGVYVRLVEHLPSRFKRCALKPNGIDGENVDIAIVSVKIAHDEFGKSVSKNRVCLPIRYCIRMQYQLRKFLRGKTTLSPECHFF